MAHFQLEGLPLQRLKGHSAQHLTENSCLMELRMINAIIKHLPFSPVSSMDSEEWKGKQWKGTVRYQKQIFHICISSLTWGWPTCGVVLIVTVNMLGHQSAPELKSAKRRNADSVEPPSQRRVSHQSQNQYATRSLSNSLTHCSSIAEHWVQVVKNKGASCTASVSVSECVNSHWRDRVKLEADRSTWMSIPKKPAHGHTDTHTPSALD